MKYEKKMICALAAGALCCGVAVAQPPEDRGGRGRGPEHLMERADANGDGALTRAELEGNAPPFVLERFDELDANGSGSLTLDEFPKRGPEGRGERGERGERGPEGRGERGERGPEGRGGDRHQRGHGPRGGNPREMMERLDTNKDGQVTREEFIAGGREDAEKHFDRMDRNGDGVLNESDRPERGERGPRGPRGDEASGDRGPRGPRGDEGRGPRGEIGPMSDKGDRPHGPRGEDFDWQEARSRMIEQCDADKDGRVTYEELETNKPGFPRRAFSRLDGNSDGAITSDDPRPAGPPERRGPRGDSGMRERIREADVNNDHRLSYEEAQTAFPKMTREQFDERDKNGDGFMSPEDRQR